MTLGKTNKPNLRRCTARTNFIFAAILARPDTNPTNTLMRRCDNTDVEKICKYHLLRLIARTGELRAFHNRIPSRTRYVFHLVDNYNRVRESRLKCISRNLITQFIARTSFISVSRAFENAQLTPNLNLIIRLGTQKLFFPNTLPPTENLDDIYFTSLNNY